MSKSFRANLGDIWCRVIFCRNLDFWPNVLNSGTLSLTALLMVFATFVKELDLSPIQYSHLTSLSIAWRPEFVAEPMNSL